MNKYQLLASSIDHQLGKNFSLTELGDIQSAINRSKGLVEQAEAHGVASFFYQFTKDYGFELTEETKRQLQSLTLRHKLASETRQSVLRSVINQFAEQEIDLVLLKGIALRYMIYDQSMTRPMRDMDILIRQSDLVVAKVALEKLGFVFDAAYPSIYMGDIHHLPNAVKQVDGMNISLEVHHQVYSRDVEGSQNFEQIIGQAQKIKIGDDHEALTLDHVSMLNHLCRHTFSPAPEVRLIHQYDIVKYAQTYVQEIPWQKLQTEYAFILNTLRCLHYSIFLPEQIKQKTGKSSDRKIAGVGQAMLPYTHILRKNKNFLKRLKMLFKPSPWWMHVNYNMAPDQSLLRCYLFDHPKKVMTDINNRLFHACKNKLGNIRR